MKTCRSDFFFSFFPKMKSDDKKHKLLRKIICPTIYDQWFISYIYKSYQKKKNSTLLANEKKRIDNPNVCHRANIASY